MNLSLANADIEMRENIMARKRATMEHGVESASVKKQLLESETALKREAKRLILRKTFNRFLNVVIVCLVLALAYLLFCLPSVHNTIEDVIKNPAMFIAKQQSMLGRNPTIGYLKYHFEVLEGYLKQKFLVLRKFNWTRAFPF
jgi:hypothetical protein